MAPPSCGWRTRPRKNRLLASPSHHQCHHPSHHYHHSYQQSLVRLYLCYMSINITITVIIQEGPKQRPPTSSLLFWRKDSCCDDFEVAKNSRLKITSNFKDCNKLKTKAIMKFPKSIPGETCNSSYINILSGEHGEIPKPKPSCFPQPGVAM